MARSSGLVPVLAGSMLVDCLELAALLVAAPSIAHELDLAPFGAQWVLTGFAAGFVIGLLAGPRATARWQRRQVFLAALAAYFAAAVCSSLADSAAVLVAGEVVKGCSAALTAPAGLAMITAAFEGERRQRAVLTYSLVGASGSTAGLVLSGLLTPVSWRLTLLMPAVAVAVLFAAAWRVLPDRSPPPAPPRFSVLAVAPLARSALGAFSLNGAYLGLVLLISFQLQDEHAWSSWQVALMCCPTTVPLALTLPFAKPVVTHVGTPVLIAIGSLCAVAGCVWYLLEPRAAAVPPTVALLGLAFVFSFAALNMQAGSVPGGAPLFQTAVQLGAVVVLPLATALPLRPALAVITCVGVVGALAAASGLRTPLS